MSSRQKVHNVTTFGNVSLFKLLYCLKYTNSITYINLHKINTKKKDPESEKTPDYYVNITTITWNVSCGEELSQSQGTFFDKNAILLFNCIAFQDERSQVLTTTGLIISVSTGFLVTTLFYHFTFQDELSQTLSATGLIITVRIMR